ncbi:MAG: segregation/condensation protein A [Alphaproteobacteria bacterium]|nr:segregation/condensation protein A [Alphaproteobacteria bacterium]
MLACDAHTGFVRTEDYDGPLELLLFLIRREGIDPRDLRVAPICDAYLAQVELMDALDLDVAGDFVVMASTLCLLKSRELLPRSVVDDEEEEEDLRDGLVRRLVEYERYREASERLGDRHLLGRDEFTRPHVELDVSERPVEPGCDAMGLLEVLYELVQRQQAPEPVHEVELEVYSLREMASWVLTQLGQGPRSLADLLSELDRKLDRVVCFLASLEMARLQLLDVRQSHHLAPVVLHPVRDPEGADLSSLAGGI